MTGVMEGTGRAPRQVNAEEMEEEEFVQEDELAQTSTPTENSDSPDGRLADAVDYSQDGFEVATNEKKGGLKPPHKI